MTCPWLPDVSEEHTAFPAGWPSSWVWAGQGQESLTGTAALSAVEVPCEPAQPQTASWACSHTQNHSLIKLQHMCYRSSQFWLRTMKTGVISITFCSQCELKKEVGVEPFYTPVCLNACVCVIYWTFITTQFNFHLFCFTHRGCEILQPCPACFFSALLTVPAFLCPLTSVMN